MKRRILAFIMIFLFASLFSITIFAEQNKSSSNKKLTYEDMFLDPNLAKLIATYTNSNVSDVVDSKKLSEIKILSNKYKDKKVVDALFHLSGIANLKKLEKIELSGIKIISIPDEIKDLKSLKYIDLSNNKLVYVSDFVYTLPSLTELHIDNNNLNMNLSTPIAKNIKKYSFSDQNTEIGNVPEKFIPQSNITFGANGEPILTEVVKAAHVLPGEKELDGVEWEDYIPQVDDMVERLPVFEVKDYYIAKSGARAQYGSEGEFVRVRGDYDYISDIDKYKVKGEYKNGIYKGNFTEFTTYTELEDDNITRLPSKGKIEEMIYKICSFLALY